jgi:hypothetical protein
MFMVFEVCNSMKMNFCLGFGDGVGLLLQVSWLLNEKCRSHCREIRWRKGELKRYKQKSLGFQGGKFFELQLESRALCVWIFVKIERRNTSLFLSPSNLKLFFLLCCSIMEKEKD